MTTKKDPGYTYVQRPLTTEEENIIKESMSKVINSAFDREKNPDKRRILINDIHSACLREEAKAATRYAYYAEGGI